jgi:CRISPR/Cas system-associated endonuclease Cas3-HD
MEGEDKKGVVSRLSRDSKPVAFVEKFVSTHKVIVAAIALIIVGATSARMLSAYASKDDVNSLRAHDAQIQEQIQELRQADAEIRSAISVVKEVTKNTRDDIRSLLQHVLANPLNKHE